MNSLWPATFGVAGRQTLFASSFLHAEKTTAQSADVKFPYHFRTISLPPPYQLLTKSLRFAYQLHIRRIDSKMRGEIFWGCLCLHMDLHTTLRKLYKSLCRFGWKYIQNYVNCK